ncbi:MAG: SpaA isopeptide-forming pilin-related protein [Oscillospiraceae bacterium]|nr:SpaA isopeptide-forming pilin-related protein [Oscillospiraceae bacterium]
MKNTLNAAVRRLLADKRLKRIAAATLAPLLVVGALAGSLWTARPAQTAPYTGPAVKVHGTYRLSHTNGKIGGGTNGYNFYHIYGVPGTTHPNGALSNDFLRNTFCTNRGYTYVSGATHNYYYNGRADASAGANPVFYDLLRNTLGMTAQQYSHLRYGMLYANIHKDSYYQRAHWYWLGTNIPSTYGFMATHAIKEGFVWQDSMRTKYFGAKASSNFQGLGAIASEATINVGAKVSVILKYNGSTSIPSPFAPGEGNYSVGPFVLEWAPGSSAVLAQLNSGPNKDTSPSFNLSGGNSRAVFVKTPGSIIPLSYVKLGEPFYIEYRQTWTNLWDAQSGLTFNFTIRADKDLVTEVCGDQIFVTPYSQNQLNVDYTTARPSFSLNVTFKSPVVPPPQPPPYIPPMEPPDVDYSIEKQVTEDNMTDNQGDYEDILTVLDGTNVMHKMSVTVDNPNRTILEFVDLDYDIPLGIDGPSHPFWDVYRGVAYVTSFAEFATAVNENKSIKLMNDITIPPAPYLWDPPALYTGRVVDGNGFTIHGSTFMNAPLFRTVGSTSLPVTFFRVRFVGFVIDRRESGATSNGTPNATLGLYVGALTDRFNVSGSRLIDVYTEGTLRVHLTATAYVGLVSGHINLNSGNNCFGVSALANISVTTATSLGRVGGLFGQSGAHIENCHLLPGSEIVSSAPRNGGIAGDYNQTPGSISFCSADFRYTQVAPDSGSYNNNSFGVFAGAGLTSAPISNCYGNVVVAPSVSLYSFGSASASPMTNGNQWRVVVTYKGSELGNTINAKNHTPLGTGSSEIVVPTGYLLPDTEYSNAGYLTDPTQMKNTLYVTDQYLEYDKEGNLVNGRFLAPGTNAIDRDLYVYENGEFKRLGQTSGYTGSVAGNATVENQLQVNMMSPLYSNGDGTSTLEYYFKVPDIQEGSYHNTAKVTPNMRGGSKSDDDWVITDEDSPDEIRFNLVKMGDPTNFPGPLPDCVFELYRSDAIHSDFSSLNLSDGSWSLLATLEPAGTQGLEESARPLITPGSYVLVETDTPEYYTDNIGKQWYLVFSGGELKMYSDPLLTEEVPLGTPSEMDTDTNTHTLYYSATLNNDMNQSTPKATIRLIKYNENGTQTLPGQTIEEIIDGSEVTRFTGAIYLLSKFEDDSFDGTSEPYGEMLSYGTQLDGSTPLQNWSELEPGYYELIEVAAPDGYAIDPTPIYIHFDGAAMTLTIDTQTHTVSPELDATVTVNSPTDKTIHTRDRKFSYSLKLQKYDTSDDSALTDIVFQLIAPNGTVINQYTTAGLNGETPLIPIPSEPDGIYTLHEVAPPNDYHSIPDYTIEVRGGDLYFRDGPHGYDFKIARGWTDDKYYVILDPDGDGEGPAAKTVYDEDEDYPADLFLDDGDSLTIGLIHGTLRVPNARFERGKLQIKKFVPDDSEGGQSRPFVFTVYDQATNSPVDLSIPPITVNGHISGSSNLALGQVAAAHNGTVTIDKLLTGVYYVVESGEASYIAEWVVEDETGGSGDGSVSGGVTVSHNGTSIVTFTNLYDAPLGSPILPETGGPGKETFTVSAGILILLFLPGAFAYRYHRRRRRLVLLE